VTLKKTFIAAALGFTVVATSASAEIVCNRGGECWHVKEHAWIQPEHGLVVHPDAWKFGERDHYRWREHEGRGYWHEGRWVEIH
jgi:hypothetical protein